MEESGGHIGRAGAWGVETGKNPCVYNMNGWKWNCLGVDDTITYLLCISGNLVQQVTGRSRKW